MQTTFFGMTVDIGSGGTEFMDKVTELGPATSFEGGLGSGIEYGAWLLCEPPHFCQVSIRHKFIKGHLRLVANSKEALSFFAHLLQIKIADDKVFEIGPQKIERIVNPMPLINTGFNQ